MTIPNNLPTVVVEVFDGKGGPGKNAIPVKDDWGLKGSLLGHAENGRKFRIVDRQAVSIATAALYFKNGEAEVECLDGNVLFQSLHNYLEERGHLRPVVTPEPVPTPTPTPTPTPGETITDEQAAASLITLMKWLKQ